MININIPNISTAYIQPDFTKFAQFPGFVFYHSLKEWYIIFNNGSITVQPDYLLDELNLAGSFSYLIGNNSSIVFIAQPETAKLLRLQLDPNTANVIARDIIDIKSLIQINIGESRDVGITSGFVLNNYVILGCAVTEGTTVGQIGHKPYILLSSDNGITYTSIEVPTTGIINNYLTPTGIARINFYNTYYYVFFLNGYNTDNFYLYVVSEEELFNNNSAPEYLQTSPTGFTFGSANKKHINRQFIWNHNKLYSLSDDRTKLIKFDTGLHKSSNSYPTQYPILPFNITQESITGEIFTQIQKVPDNNILTNSTKIFKKQNNLTNGATPGFNEITYGNYQLWDEVLNGLESNNAILDFEAYTDENFLFLTLVDIAGTLTPKLNHSNFTGIQTSINLGEIPLSRFNTGSIHWTGEVVDATLEPLWNQDISEALWLSHDEDTFIINYGGVDFDYILTMNIDLPIAATITGTIWVDDQVTDILVDGNSQGLTYSGPGSLGNTISLTLPKGPSAVTFQIRNTANPAPYNPTGIKIQWNNLSLPSIPATHSDIFVDLEEDRLYVSLEPFAWILELSTLNIIACIDLLAEELPGGPFLIPTGVNQTAGKPIKWKWIKEFNKVYIYNEYHDSTYTSLSDKFFYTWKIDSEDPSYHEMYSAFELDVTTCTHLHYFFAINNELHGILSSRNASALTNNFRSIQYRISGLANFAQVTSNPVTAGPFVTQDVFVANDGKIYLSKSSEPSSYTDSNTNLFVYVNNNGINPSSGSYVIVIDGVGAPYNFDTFQLFTSTPTGYQGIQPSNFGKIAKFINIPGDYNGSTIINSTKFRNELFEELDEEFGNTQFNQQRLVFNNTDEDFVIGKLGKTERWAYFVIYNNVNSNYRLVRTRTVYYSTL